MEPQTGLNTWNFKKIENKKHPNVGLRTRGTTYDGITAESLLR